MKNQMGASNKPGWATRNWEIPPQDMFDLTDKVILVTGAASGLGRAISLGVGYFGAKVILADINPTAARNVAKSIDSDTLVLEVDVRDSKSVHNMVESAVERFGRIDVSFNIPGINIRKPIIELSEEEWQKVLDINITGMYHCAKKIGKIMLNQGYGNMINMSSARGIVGGSNQSIYSVTKAGVIQLTRVLACEWAPKIRVNALAPGYIKTPLVREAMQDQEWYERMKNKHILKRFGEPEEIVGAAIFLASDASTFVTGAVIAVDGGWTAS